MQDFLLLLVNEKSGFISHMPAFFLFILPNVDWK